MIINNTYFLSKPLFIPQAVSTIPSTGTGLVSPLEDLNAYINDKESDLLLSFLGYEQYTELLSQLNSDGTFIDGAIQKWVDLVDGKEDWKGLRYTVGNMKRSLIADFVYFYWLADDNVQHSTTGLQRPEVANSNLVMPNDVQAKIWTKFLQHYGYYNNARNWPTFFTNWNGVGMTWLSANQDLNIVTLYDFMTKNSDVYDMSFFATYQPVNPYNL